MSNFLYHQKSLYNLTRLSARCELCAIDQEVWGAFSLEPGWISKRQRICFAVASILDEYFMGEYLRFDVGALSKFLSLGKLERVQMGNGLYYFDGRGDIHDRRV